MVTMVYAADGAMVANRFVTTHHDKVPRFCNQAGDSFSIALRSGNWSDAGIWSTGAVPGNGAKVQIPANVVVVYDVHSDVHIECIEVQQFGTLFFDPVVNTKLRITDLMVLPDGALIVGDESSPISGSVEIFWPDVALKQGTVASPGIDPQGWGNGLIVFGKLRMHGRGLNETFVRFATEPKAGDTSLSLGQGVNWQAGDVLYLGDTTSSLTDSEIEYPVVQSVSGTTVNLSAPLQFDHRGARYEDGTLQHLPHVANISRNVDLRSENKDGVRGHTAFLARADIDVRYVKFTDLGRTKNEKADNTTFDSNGNVTHIGTNQLSRYPYHLHHLVGPRNPTNTGYQSIGVGNSIVGALKWSFAIHGTHYSLVKDNVVVKVKGAGITTEDGSEAYNVIDHNFVGDVKGKSSGANFKLGLGGDAFWFRGQLNYVRNNVAVNANRAGYEIFLQRVHSLNRNEMKRPLFRGANMHNDAEVEYYNAFRTPMLEFVDNEVYGSASAYDNWNSIPNERQYFRNLIAWHTSDNNFGISSYLNTNVTFENLTLLGDLSALDPNKLQKYQAITATGIQAVRTSTDLHLINVNIRGAQTGIETPAHAVGDMVVENSYIQAYRGIDVRRLTNGGSNSTAAELPRSTLTVRNTKFRRMPVNNVEPDQYSLYLQFPTQLPTDPDNTNLTASNEVYLYDFNGVPGANYRVYYPEQAPDVIMPQSILHADPRHHRIACPEANLTNRECWNRHGVALAGSVAPCAEVDGDNCQAARARATALDIHGLVFPIVGNNTEPTVSAGADQTVNVNSQATLNAQVTDDGFPNPPGTTSIVWSKFSGPGNVAFLDKSLPSTKASFSTAGTYILRITANDGAFSSSDDVKIVVLPDGSKDSVAPQAPANLGISVSGF